MNKTLSQITIKDIAIATGIAIFFIADRILKSLALASDNGQMVKKLIGDFFLFRFTANYNIAFSLPISGPFLNALILLVIGGLIYYIFYLTLNKKGQKSEIYLLTIITIGAISNILDRFFCGYVIDYLELRYFTVFNLADVLISGGAIVLILKNIKIKNHVRELRNK
jgi:signal peptidase II